MAVLTLACATPTPDITRALHGTTGTTPADAIADHQMGAASLEDNVQAPAAMDLGTSVGGTTCDASGQDVAYCNGNDYVQCDSGHWKSITCPDPQYCGNLNNVVGCYSATSNDPDTTPDAVDAGPTAVDAASPADAGPTCPNIAGDYTFMSVSGDGCPSDNRNVTLEQTGCDVMAMGAFGTLSMFTFVIGPDGSTANCGSSTNCLSLSGGTLTLRSDPCTFVYTH